MSDATFLVCLVSYVDDKSIRIEISLLTGHLTDQSQTFGPFKHPRLRTRRVRVGARDRSRSGSLSLVLGTPVEPSRRGREDVEKWGGER